MTNTKNEILQEHIRAIVQEDVFVNHTNLVEELLEKQVFLYEDIENVYQYPEWQQRLLGEDLFFEGGTEQAKEEFAKNFERLVEESDDLLQAQKISEKTHERNLRLIDEAKYEFEAIDTEPQEIFEWWAISAWLAEKFAKQGAPVLRNNYGAWWGRTTTGTRLGNGDALFDMANRRIQQESV